MNVIFLNIDGVINTEKGYDVDGNFREGQNSPKDGKVNNYRAVKLLNKLCKEYKLDLVIDCKRWRNKDKKDENGNYELLPYKQLLYNSGIDEYTYIYGHTPATDFNKDMEIKIFLEKNNQIEKFIILESEKNDISEELKHFTIVCNKEKGFTPYEYRQAAYLLENFPEVNKSNSYAE